MHFSILSDLKKTTEVVESLSTTSTRCSVTEITNLLQDLINRMRNIHQIELELCGLAINISSFSHLLRRVYCDAIVDHLALMHIIITKWNQQPQE